MGSVWIADRRARVAALTEALRGWWDPRLVSPDRLRTLAGRLDAVLETTIRMGESNPMSGSEWVAREAEREAARRAEAAKEPPLTAEQQTAVDLWKRWCEAGNSVPAPPVLVQRGRPPLPALDDALEAIGAAFEELTGRKPARRNAQQDVAYTKTTERGGDFLKFARRVAAGYLLPDSFLSDQRLKSVVERRKKSQRRL